MFVLQDQCGWKSDLPTILSVCLISLEPDSVLRVMQDQFTPGEIRDQNLIKHEIRLNYHLITDERFRQLSANQCNLSTPKDVSVTHILVFPTSATAQVSSPHSSIEKKKYLFLFVFSPQFKPPLTTIRPETMGKMISVLAST